jgi:Mg2+/Co2+ transporter CorB
VLSAVLPGALGVLIATVVMTVLIVVFGEILPKTLAITRPEVVARALALPTYWVVRIFGPLAYAAQWIVRHTLRPFGVKLSMEMDVLAAHEEIRGTVDYHHSEGLVETGDRYMLGGVLDLAELDVSDVMVHRKSMEMLDVGLPVRDVVGQALEAPHTRLPLYRDDPENIVGVLHAKDLLRALAAHEGRIEGIDIMAIAREPWFIPETTNLKDQLNAFLKRRSHFALVVDEYGALQGLDQLHGVLRVHIVVGGAEVDQKVALEVLRVLHGGCPPVGFRLLWQQAHVAFRIGRVVQTVVGPR